MITYNAETLTIAQAQALHDLTGQGVIFDAENKRAVLEQAQN